MTDLDTKQQELQADKTPESIKKSIDTAKKANNQEKVAKTKAAAQVALHKAKRLRMAEKAPAPAPQIQG